LSEILDALVQIDDLTGADKLAYDLVLRLERNIRRDGQRIDSNEELEKRIIRTLAHIGAPAVNQFLNWLKNDETGPAEALGSELASELGRFPNRSCAIADRLLASIIEEHDSSVLAEHIILGMREAAPIGRLVAELHSRPRRAIAEILVKLNRQPGNDRERALYAIALGRWNDAIGLGTHAVEPLMTSLLLGSDRKCAAEALGEIGGAAALEALITALSSDYEVSSAARKGLVKFGTSAIDRLVAILMNDEWKLRRDSALVLKELNWQPLEPGQKAVLAVVSRDWRTAAEVGSVAVESLVSYLKSESYKSDQVVAAVDTLRQIGDRPAVEALVGALVHPVREVRISAATALDSLGWTPDDDVQRAKRAIALMEWSYYPSKQKQEFVDEIKMLGPAVEETLISALEYIAEDLRVIVTRILGDWAGPRCTETLIRIALSDPATHEETEWGGRTSGQWGDPGMGYSVVTYPVRTVALEGLKKISRTLVSKEQIVGAIIPALRDGNADVRCAAVEALDGLGWKPADDVQCVLRALARPWWDQRAQNQVRELGPSVRGTLIEALAYASKEAKREIVKILGEEGDSGGMEPH
jgi:PBS lyase HEAT-like repeat.